MTKAEQLFQMMSSLSCRVISEQELVIRLASSIVPRFADWCAIDQYTGQIRTRKMMGSTSGLRLDLIRQINSYYSSAPAGSFQETNKNLFFKELVPQDLSIFSYSEQELEILNNLGLSSAISVPIRGPEKTLGRITLFQSRTREPFNEEDLLLFQELGERVGLIIEHSRLYFEMQAALSTREEVLKIVSHELKNPLTAILLRSELLGKNSDYIERYSKEISRSARQMSTLIDDLLELSRFESGKFSLFCTDFKIQDLAEDLLDIIQPLAEHKNILTKLEIENPKKIIRGDQKRLTQVFVNLVSNAIKFTPSGGNIELIQKSRDSLIQFEIVDNGVGIDEEGLQHLFKGYWQAQGTRQLGLGIGLSIAKNIVESHGGKIWAESKPGVGSKFIFVIPEQAVTKFEQTSLAVQDADNAHSQRRFLLPLS